MELTYQLIRSKRKTVALLIDRDARLVIKAPLGTPVSVIEKILREKSAWVEKTMAVAQTALKKRQSFSLRTDGAYFLGEKYGLKFLRRSGAALFDGRSFYVPDQSDEQLRLLLAEWYRTQAEEIIAERAAYFSKVTGLKPRSLRINAASTRWGSCSADNRLNFSWKLILMSPAVVDYVVVHELSHIREHNHSAAFWKTVEQFMPDYQTRQAEMKKLCAEANLWFWNEG